MSRDPMTPAEARVLFARVNLQLDTLERSVAVELRNARERPENPVGLDCRNQLGRVQGHLALAMQILTDAMVALDADQEVDHAA